MRADPEISIIITSYNYAAFLPRAIESATRQQVPGLEIVVVDNASTDASWDSIERAAAADDRISAYRNPQNLGMIGNHVRGLELARAERVLFLSADDYLLDGHIGRLDAAHRAHPNVDYFFTSYVKVTEDDRFIKYFGHPGLLRGSYFGGRNEFADLLTYDCYTCFPTTLFKREELLSYGGFRHDVVAGDLDTYLRLAANGARFGFLEGAGVAIRLHAREISGEESYVATGKQLRDHVLLLEHYINDDNAQLYRGREHGIARLLTAKINNLRNYPDVAERVLPELEPRIASVAERLKRSRSFAAAKPQTVDPLVSVVIECTDDIQGSLDAIEMAAADDYERLELAIVANAKVDISALAAERCGRRTFNMLAVRTPLSQAAALNDALKLCNGDIVTYAAPGIAWRPGHIRKLAAAFEPPNVTALAIRQDASVQIVDPLNGALRTIERIEGFAGAPLVESAIVGESVPLAALAHRREAIDRIGLIDERLNHTAPFLHAMKMLTAGEVAVDVSIAVDSAIRLDRLPPALNDPNGYLGELKSIYESYPGDAALQQRRQQHLSAMVGVLQTAANAPSAQHWLSVVEAARGAGERRALKRTAGDPPRIFVVDDRVPYDQLGRGYPRARKMLEVLRDAGFEVVLYPLEVPNDEPPLNSGIPGVHALYGQGRNALKATLAAFAPTIDVLLVSRPHNMKAVREAFGDALPAERQFAVIYDAEALYVERERLLNELQGTPMDDALYHAKLRDELRLTEGCDAVICVSERERALFEQSYRGPIAVLPFSIEPRASAAGFETRAGVLFVGAIEADSPNEDALLWFVQNVAPQLRADEGPIRHAGVMKSERLLREAGATVEFLGVVDDLSAAYDAARIFVAPTRFAAGLPQKVYEAAAHGLPVVVTPLLAAQTGWNAGRDMLVADSPAQWNAAISELNTDEARWRSLRDAATAAVERDVSPAAFSERLIGVVRGALSNAAGQ